MTGTVYNISDFPKHINSLKDNNSYWLCNCQSWWVRNCAMTSMWMNFAGLNPKKLLNDI